MNKNKTLKAIILISLAFIISVVIVRLISFTAIKSIVNTRDPISMADTQYTSIEDALDGVVAFRNTTDVPEDNEISRIIYTYENNNQYLVMYNSVNGKIWAYLFDKSIENGETLYRYNFSATIILHDTWSDLIPNFYIKTVENKDDIDMYEGIEPIVTKIEYVYVDKEYEEYLLLIDRNA